VVEEAEEQQEPLALLVQEGFADHPDYKDLPEWLDQQGFREDEVHQGHLDL